MVDRKRENRLTYRRFAQRIRVPVGFVLAPLLLIVARPTALTLMAGGVLAVIGLAVRAWASGHLKKNLELTASGPYAHTRNPLYLGTFILGTGIAICGGMPWFVALFMALYLLIYLPVMLAEADTLRALFPVEYKDYSQYVPLFLPRLTPYRASISGSKKRFEASRYLRHREYRAALGFIAVYAVLAAKLYLNGHQ